MRGTARSAFERESLVATCKASGLSPKAFAEREHLPASTLYQWLAKSSTRSSGIRIARVIRRSEAPRAVEAETSVGEPLVVELGVARVRVPAGFDRRLLGGILDVLESRCRIEPS